MPPSRILDSHIHLWPSTSTASTDHGWMTDPAHFLARRHGISDYKAVVSAAPAGPSLSGFVYVETDRYLPSRTPDISPEASEDQTKRALEKWAKAPLDELRFLRRIVEESPHEGDGFERGDGDKMKGAVVWAPFHLAPSLLQSYLAIAESVAGEKLWGRIAGFRYLLQGKEKGEVTKLVGSDDWVKNIAGLGKGRQGKGWAFDVGVDIHRDGPEPLGAVGEMIRRVREQEAESGAETKPVRFVLNHLCKHALASDSQTEPTKEWQAALAALGPDQNVFMKLSGAFNEFDSATPSTAADLVHSLSSIVPKVFEAFPERVMFGSDWPVCNVGGPAGEEANWGVWVESVERLLEEAKVGGESRDSVWWGAGSRAYGV
ncbi:L-rhamnono-1,4-lactonase [Ascochyta rabiei]|uniref:Catalytic n=1 Tax=Didymella rabiei TaxID=5454 RepID=A0A162WJA3_DIDRA|nr:L-rhamnono-1,4-lactonase [Ascochyta rabiei]KZM19065.1 catalytic [Ascochyta rabiei]UPX13233.1 L-rhamnono-1,4-lactonase [Ascochyta rabiei]